MAGSLAEAYDGGGDEDARLLNVSVRSQVGTDSEVLIAGFVIDGPLTLLVRGEGPALTDFGVNGALVDPVLQLYDSHGWLAQSDDLGTISDATEIAAEADGLGALLLPEAGVDAALIVTLSAGVYSAVVTGNNGGTGVGLVEIYVLSP